MLGDDEVLSYGDFSRGECDLREWDLGEGDLGESDLGESDLGKRVLELLRVGNPKLMRRLLREHSSFIILIIPRVRRSFVLNDTR